MTNIHYLYVPLAGVTLSRVWPQSLMMFMWGVWWTLVSQEGRFQFFQQGNCIVHHMFGSEVVQRVRADYPDAFHTAHLEVRPSIHHLHPPLLPTFT